MPDIKLKEKSIIKQLDKKVVQTQNFKNNLVTTKERLNEFTSKEENTSAENYASNHIQNDISYLSRKGATKSNEIGKKSLENTKQNIIKSKEKISNIKSKIIISNNGDGYKEMYIGEKFKKRVFVDIMGRRKEESTAN